MIIINRFDNNTKLNNAMCILESVKIHSYQTNLKTSIHHYVTTQNGHYTSVIKKGHSWYHCYNNQIRDTKLDLEI